MIVMHWWALAGYIFVVIVSGTALAVEMYKKGYRKGYREGYRSGINRRRV